MNNELDEAANILKTVKNTVLVAKIRQSDYLAYTICGNALTYQSGACIQHYKVMTSTPPASEPVSTLHLPPNTEHVGGRQTQVNSTFS